MYLRFFILPECNDVSHYKREETQRQRYQSFVNGQSMMNILLLVLLGFLAAANAVPAYVPHGEVVTYNYTVDVKAGIIDPAPYASQFYINSAIRMQRYNGDPTLTNAYYLRLVDVKYKLFNGHAVHHEAPNSEPQSLPEATKVIESPFVIVFDENGHLQGVMFVEKETKWSKNIKRSIASVLQLDLINMFPSGPPQSRSFITRENTIHGSCQVAYTVHTTDSSMQGNQLMVTKFHEPMKCSNFSYYTFNHVEPNKCHIKHEDGMSTASRRVYNITNRGQEIVINQIIGHGVINYFPWLANAEAHYLLTNQTMILHKTEPISSEPELLLDKNISPVEDVTFSTPTTCYSDTGDLDVTQGRHDVDIKLLIDKLMKMLEEAAGYLKMYHMDVKQPEWKHGQTINRILQIMSFMNQRHLQEVYSRINNPQNITAETMKNIFLGVVPKVGTTASCLFIRNSVLQNTVPNWTAVTMLSALPMHVKMPSKTLLEKMKCLIDPSNLLSFDVKKASILCFSTLIHKTYANGTSDEDVTNYLEDFKYHLENESTDELKVVYLMAFKNVGMVNILKFLEPIIRGEVNISNRPDYIRAQAIWAIKKVVVNLPDFTHNLLWPILANAELPVTLRVAAYDVLINQLPDLGRLMNVYWFMVYEKNEHLYNYHVETIKGLATSVDPCLMPVREMAKKILRFTRLRQVSGPLSTNFYVDSFDETFGHGEAVKVSLIIDQWTGLPSVGSVNYMMSVARKPANFWGVHWHISGSEKIMEVDKKNVFGDVKGQIKNKNVYNLLATIASKLYANKDIETYISITWKDNVVMVLRFDTNYAEKLFQDLKLWKDILINVNSQYVLYDDHFEMQVPTDFGVPAILTTKTPTVHAFKSNANITEEKNMTRVQLACKYQEWKHGEYVMTIYNPIADVWHSIRRTATRDIVVPANMTIVYNKDWTNVKVTSPRLPITEYSTVGLLTQAKNYVTVRGDKTGALPASCPSCLHIQNVTGIISDKTYKRDLHSKDTALRFFSGIYNCEGHVTPLPVAELHNAFSTYHNMMDYKEHMKLVMRLRQMIKNNMISSQGASCSNLYKIEPSEQYTASRVYLSLKVKKENVPNNPLHYFNDMIFNVHGTMDVKTDKYPYDESIRKWDAYVNAMLSKGHTSNNVKIILTRITPGEKNLRICINGQKEYPEVDTDILNFTGTKNETIMKVTITMGKSEDKCVRNEMDVTITVKGEMSAEQPHHKLHEELYALCYNDKHDPQLSTEGQHVPKTLACKNEAVVHTTLRKYTTNVTLNKVPLFLETCAHMLQDNLLSHFFSHMTYVFNRTNPGSLRFVTEFSTWTPHLDVTILQPIRSYKLLQLPYGNAVWHNLMDNVHFSVSTLTDYINDNIKTCTVYPEVTLTYDNTKLPFSASNNEKWILLTGDINKKIFAVFVKKIENKRLALQVFVGEHEMQIIPEDASVVVIVNGIEVPNPKDGVLIPQNDLYTYAMRLTTNFAHWNIDSMRLPLNVHYTVNSITTSLRSDFRGRISGMCGHMNGFHNNVVPTTYSLP